MEGLAGSQGNSLRMRFFYGRTYPRAHSKLGLGSKIQTSTNISRLIAKTSSTCLETEIGKNDTLSQLVELFARFHTPG